MEAGLSNRRRLLSIEETYESILRGLPKNVQVEPLEIVKGVERYRHFWKPENVKVLLLAESHVYTDKEDFDIECRKHILRDIVGGCPTRFVRFVYCLGYGENRLLARTRTDRRNPGTWQYWRIFSSCVADGRYDSGFRSVLTSGTPSLMARLQNKVSVLKKMKRLGVWLLDASILGLYGGNLKSDGDIYGRAITVCWENRIAGVIDRVSPQHVIVIGKGVGRVLRSKLREMGVPFTVLSQPQDRRWREEDYGQYHRICQRFL